MESWGLTKRIHHTLPTLSAGERTLAHYMLQHTEEVPFLSSTELAKRAKLSDATVTRFAQRLGYEGFVELRRLLREELRTAYAPRVPASVEGFVSRYWDFEIRNLERDRHLPEATLREIADALVDCSQVWLGGTRTLRPVAAYAKYQLGLFRPGVRLLVEDVRTHPEFLIDVQRGDVAVIFAMRRYSKSTTRVGEAVAKKGAQLILIADDGAPPLARIASKSLQLSTKSASTMASVTPFLSVTQLITMLAAAKLGNSRTDAAEEYLKRYDAYEY